MFAQSVDCTELHQWSAAIYMQQNQDTMKNVISQYNKLCCSAHSTLFIGDLRDFSLSGIKPKADQILE